MLHQVITINLSDIQPNPFRDLKEYPLEKGRVNALKTSIKKTGLWPRDIVRKVKIDGKIVYQRPFGHHTAEAARQCGHERVQVVVLDLTDDDMIRMMAAENMDHWNPAPAMIDQSVEATLNFLNSYRNKFNTISELEKAADPGVSGFFAKFFKSDEKLKQFNDKGVGRKGITEYLHGLVTQRTVQASLKRIKTIKGEKEKEKKRVLACRIFPDIKTHNKFDRMLMEKYSRYLDGPEDELMKFARFVKDDWENNTRLKNACKIFDKNTDIAKFKRELKSFKYKHLIDDYMGDYKNTLTNLAKRLKSAWEKEAAIEAAREKAKKREAEAEARKRKAEADQKKAEEARRKAEEARRKAEERERKAKAQANQKKAEEARRKAEEARRKAEEAKAKATKERKKAHDRKYKAEEARRKAEEAKAQAKKKQEELRQQRLRKEREERIRELGTFLEAFINETKSYGGKCETVIKKLVDTETEIIETAHPFLNINEFRKMLNNLNILLSYFGLEINTSKTPKKPINYIATKGKIK